MSQHESGVLLGRAKMEANRTYTNESGVSSRKGAEIGQIWIMLFLSIESAKM